MTADDIVQVADIERESFPSIWPQTAYKRELTNKLARYLVLTELRDTRIEPPATAGLWGCDSRSPQTSIARAVHRRACQSKL